MKVHKKEFVQKLNKLKSIVPRRTQNEALQGVLVKDGYLIANNLETLVKANLEGIVEEFFIIPERAFDLINNLPDEEIEITADNNNVITIRVAAAKIKNTYKSISPDSFPLPVIEENNSKLTIKSEVLLNSIKRVRCAVADESTKEVAKALCLQANNGILNFVGCDGRVVAWDKVKYEGEFELLIPKTTVEKVLSIGLNGDVSINYSKNGALFVTNEYEIYTRLINGKYFTYKDMFKELPVNVTVERSQLLDALVRAKMCTKDLAKVDFTIKGNVLSVSIKDNNTDYSESVHIKEELAEEITISFNPKLIIDTLKAFDCENVYLYLAGVKTPMIVKAEDSDFVAMIAPVVNK